MSLCGIKKRNGRRCRRIAHILTYRKREGLVETCWYHTGNSRKRNHRGRPLQKAPNR